ncbi:unnamed protein product [Arabidopsis lyrata]|nr:unnamed protein product [Arabidopsis lyrata]
MLNHRSGISLAPGPSADDVSDYLVLAAHRTKRPDILRAFKPYHGGWNITNNHYWASVGFTGTPGFILAATWLFKWRVYPLNPNLPCSLSLRLTENTSRKRCAVEQRKRIGGLKKAKVAPFSGTARETPE